MKSCRALFSLPFSRAFWAYRHLGKAHLENSSLKLGRLYHAPVSSFPARLFARTLTAFLSLMLAVITQWSTPHEAAPKPAPVAPHRQKNSRPWWLGPRLISEPGR